MFVQKGTFPDQILECMELPSLVLNVQSMSKLISGWKHLQYWKQAVNEIFCGKQWIFPEQMKLLLSWRQHSSYPSFDMSASANYWIHVFDVASVMVQATYRKFDKYSLSEEIEAFHSKKTSFVSTCCSHCPATPSKINWNTVLLSNDLNELIFTACKFAIMFTNAYVTNNGESAGTDNQN